MAKYTWTGERPEPGGGDRGEHHTPLPRSFQLSGPLGLQESEQRSKASRPLTSFGQMVNWTETPCAFCLEFIMKFNRICDVWSNLDFPGVTSSTIEAAALFSKGEGPQVGSGKACGLFQLCDLNQQVPSLDLMFSSVLSSPIIQL